VRELKLRANVRAAPSSSALKSNAVKTTALKAASGKSKILSSSLVQTVETPCIASFP
jgi:hypothetical protein